MSYVVLSLEPSRSHRETRAHSRDTLVRVTGNALLALQFEHLCTVHDAEVLADARSIGLSVFDAGISEWTGRAGERVVSLGWDWVRTCEGGLQAFRMVAPRTNLMVVEAAGYDLAPVQLQACLWQVVDRLPWSAHAPPYGPY